MLAKGFRKRLDNKHHPFAQTQDNTFLRLCCLKQKQKDPKFGKHIDKALRSKKKREGGGGKNIEKYRPEN